MTLVRVNVNEDAPKIHGAMFRGVVLVLDHDIDDDDDDDDDDGDDKDDDTTDDHNDDD